jgi:hypothetical protein
MSGSDHLPERIKAIAGNILNLVGSTDDLYVLALRMGRATGVNL